MNTLVRLAEPLSWRIVTELFRRSPDQFIVRELHPSGGQYDCLELAEFTSQGTESWVMVNRNGSVTLFRPGKDRTWQNWVERTLSDPVRFVDEVARSLALVSPQPLPSSTPHTLMLRFIAEFLTVSIGRPNFWQCRNGFRDSSGYERSGKRNEWFEQFPEIFNIEPPKLSRDWKLEPAYCYWFLLKDDVPELGLDTDGRVYRKDGQVIELAPLYKQHRKIWSLIVAVAADLIP
ncbi:MAG: hypothetical protein Q8M16_20315 [Pirellulaceae bacterium]|nr:hypothetical protein [Pirellulaceae bacterium]